MKKLKFCLVGAGSIGRRHLHLLLERGDVEMAVAEPSDACWAKVTEARSGLTRYTSIEQALESQKPDAVIIATPHGLHAEMAMRALAAGVHVFCEKPMSDSMEECVAMLRAARASDRVLSVGFMFRFDPFIRKVKEIVDSGRIGKVVHYYSRFATYNTLLCSVTRHQENTLYSLLMNCIHDTDLLYHLTGRIPDFVFANAYKAGDMELSSPQNAVDMVYRYKTADMGANIHFNYIQHPQVHVLEIVGDKGYIRGDFMSASITVGTLDGNVERLEASRVFDDVYRAQWEHFIRAVKGELPPENPADSAIVSTLLMHAQRKSAMTGMEVSVRELAARYDFTYER